MAPDGNFGKVVAIDSEREIAAHRSTFETFRHLVLFAALHVALTLACLALAFIGQAKLIAFLLWAAGTLGMLATLAVQAGSSTAPVSSVPRFTHRR